MSAGAGNRTSREAFGSVVTAMVTPFDAAGAIDEAAVARLAEHLVDLGSDGIVVNGTTGESPTTSGVEKARLIAITKEAVAGRAKVIAGAGSNSTEHSCELARAAAAAGADGLLIVTPYYNKPPQAGLIAHFTAVATSTDLPVMLYDIPGRAGIPIHTETIIALAALPTVLAVKDAKADLFESSLVMAATDLGYYSGDDGLTLAHLANGAAGTVSVVAHVAAGHYRRMIDATDAGDLATARTIHEQLLPAVVGIMTRTQGAIMAKAALELTGVLSSRSMRLPLVAATDEQVAQLRTDLTLAGLL